MFTGLWSLVYSITWVVLYLVYYPLFALTSLHTGRLYIFYSIAEIDYVYVNLSLSVLILLTVFDRPYLSCFYSCVQRIAGYIFWEKTTSFFLSLKSPFSFSVILQQRH